MANTQPNGASGFENGTSSHHASRQTEIQNTISRPFTLQESLPYSPQTTTVPLIPVPIGASNTPSNRSIAQDLSPIAKAVYDKVGGYFRATKPVSASPQAVKPEGEKPRKPSKEPVPFSPLARIENNEAHKANASRIEVAIPSKKDFDQTSFVDVSGSQPQASLPNPPVDSQQQAQVQTVSPRDMLISPPVPTHQTLPLGRPPAFRVELPSSGIKKDEYLEVAYVPDAPSNLSSRRKDPPQRQEPIGGSLDGSERNEAALEALEILMRDVFNAVGCTLGMEQGYGHLVTLISDQEVILTAATQYKMHSAIQKVINLNCYDRVPLESLIQVMKLNDSNLKTVDSLEIRIDDGWDEAGLESWVQQLSGLETAIKAARTNLRILSGGRVEKQLYSEALINRGIDLFKAIIEDIITPLVELRPSSSIFKMLLKHKKAVSSVFISCQKLFAMLAELVTKIEFSETVINTLEYTASKLIFVENAYFEKDSAIGVQRFDGIRTVAMDMLCQIFLIKPDQRQGIIDDILTSLEKLPVGKQSSRQFKLSDGNSIQPVSALLMRLVQASSGRAVANEHGRAAMKKILDDEVSEDDELNSQPEKPKSMFSITSETLGAQQHAVAIQELEAAVAPLNDGALRNASYIINFIVKRAIGSTKSGDTPYRNLLDLFVEDFTTCLDSPDWPSAEFLLRLLMVMMVQLFEGGKTAAPAKNMALELLGSMSAAISRLRSHVKRTANAFEGSEPDELSVYLADLALHVLEQKSQVEHMIAWNGPYRASLEFLQSRLSDDPYLSSAVSFIVSDWATRVHMGYDAIQDDDPDRDQELGRLAYRLRMMIEDRRWLSNEYTFKAVTQAQAKFSYSIILLRSPLCESFSKILNILLGSMASDQATVRSKSLKSVNQVLETDPSILDDDPTVIQLILECSGDPSTQVRDSALGLLGNCIGMRPNLELPLTPRIIDRFQDAGVGVRKRAMKLARDIYLRNRHKALRSAIANGLLRRMQDPDDGVRDLARQMIEEAWFAPFYGNDSTAEYQTSLQEHVALVIQTVKTGNVTEILDKVFRSILRPKDKSLEGPFSVCSKIVTDMFRLIDNGDAVEDGAPSGRDALQVLTIFAKADPKLFSFEQVRLLKAHLATFNGAEELAAFRAVTVIYRRVLAQLPTVHSEFLTDVRLQLLKGVGKISSRGALDDLIACTRVVCDLLNDLGPMANLVASSLTGIQKLGLGQLDNKRLSILSAYSIIVGSVGKHCDLDKQIHVFRARFAKFQGDSVPRFIIDVLTPFNSHNQPLEARRASLEAIGLICQSSPRNYVLAKVYTAFQQVFQDRVPILETMVLRSFKEFLLTEERRSETGSANPSDGKKRELTVMGGTTFDDVASATTQRFLREITRIALGSQDEHAFLAMEVLGSINRQGLTHPKETGVTLITLETSANRKIAELAFLEHRSLHEKHETVLEREYVKAVQSAYNYQRDVVKDSHGATTDPFQSKLHLMMEVLKISKLRNKQRFLEKLCGQVDFDWMKLDTSGETPPHADFSRFIIENIAFFEYQSVGELQTTVSTMEKIFSTTGATVAQAMESELFNVRLDADQDHPMGSLGATTGPASSTDGQVNPAAPSSGEDAGAMAIPVDQRRFRQFTASSIILLSLWEARTYLRRLYGMGTNRHDTKAKGLAKDLNKTPVKVQGVHGDKFWDEVASHFNGLESTSKMFQKCKAFVELMNVDKEFKVQDDDADMGLEAVRTPSDIDEEDEVPERGRKRKGAGTPGGRKKRARSSSQPRKRGRPRKQTVEHNEDAEDDMDWI
ncbi:Protein rad9-like protein [Cladobotryum mycophilum]|uniref:Sister chromatid cohesion protein n=1 Tax=Cladobotryum mycophilum TaxID=491253 RepID=A0ABR0T2J3_9HYPO